MNLKKKIIILLTISILVMLTACGTKKNPIKKGVISSLPATTDFVASIDSIKTVFDTFSIKEDSILGNKIKNKNDFDEISKFLGINILNIKEIEKTGVDVTKLITLSMDIEKIEQIKKEYCWDNNLYDETGKVKGTEKKCNSYDSEDALVNLSIMIPIKNRSLFINKIEELVKKENSVSIKTEKELRTIYFKDGKKEFNGYLFPRGEYFVFTISLSGDLKTDHALKSFNSIKRLSDSKSYNIVRKKISTADGISLFFNVNGFIKKHEDFFKKTLNKLPSYKSNYKNMLLYSLDTFKGYNFFATTISLKSKDLHIKTFADVVKGSFIEKGSKNIVYNRDYVLGIKDKVLAILSFGFNVDVVYKELKETLNKNIEKSEKKISANLGISIYDDIISQLGGNFNFGVYDAIGINPMNHNFVSTFTIKDSKKFATTISKLTDKFNSMITSEKRDNLLIYTLRTPAMINLYFTIKGNSLIFTTSKTFFDKALNVNGKGDIYSVAKKNNFLKQLNGENLLFLDFYELTKVLDNFGIGKFNKFIKPFNTLSISSKYENQLFSGEFLLKTNSDKNFYQFLSDSFK